MVDRRNLLKAGLAAGALGLLPDLLRHGAVAQTVTAGAGPYGPLLPPDANGFQLPEGFSSRVLARSLQPVAGTTYPWHASPDGGATYADGGRRLDLHLQLRGPRGAGRRRVGPAVHRRRRDRRRVPDPVRHPHELRGRQDPVGHLAVVRGGPRRAGLRVQPVRASNGRRQAGPGSVHARGRNRRPDPTADLPDRGRARRPLLPLHAGELGRGCARHLAGAGRGAAGGRRGRQGGRCLDPVASPATPQSGVRLPETKPFNGGEGIWYDAGRVYFTTKGDKRVWLYDTIREHLEVLYDGRTFPGRPAHRRRQRHWSRRRATSSWPRTAATWSS